jgi:hypothetical protein
MMLLLSLRGCQFQQFLSAFVAGATQASGGEGKQMWFIDNKTSYHFPYALLHLSHQCRPEFYLSWLQLWLASLNYFPSSPLMSLSACHSYHHHHLLLLYLLHHLQQPIHQWEDSVTCILAPVTLQ